MVNFGNLDISHVVDMGELKAWSHVQKDLVDQDILIVDADLRVFDVGEAYLCTLYIVDDTLNSETEPIKALLGGKAIVGQLKDHLEKLPIMARIETYESKTFNQKGYRLVGASEQAKIALDYFISNPPAQSELPF